MSDKNPFCRFWQWLGGVHPQGVGTLLIGVAALVALWQTGSLLKEVFKIQDQAKSITSAVKELKAQTKKISLAISLLSDQLKELRAEVLL